MSRESIKLPNLEYVSHSWLNLTLVVSHYPEICFKESSCTIHTAKLKYIELMNTYRGDVGSFLLGCIYTESLPA